MIRANLLRKTQAMVLPRMQVFSAPNKFTHREYDFHSTTMLSVRKGNQVALIADGQISLGPTVFKNTAKKLRKIHDNVVCGFAGSAADCLALMELLEKEFEKYPGQTLRACLSLAKQWRTSKNMKPVINLHRQNPRPTICRPSGQ